VAQVGGVHWATAARELRRRHTDRRPLARDQPTSPRKDRCLYYRCSVCAAATLARRRATLAGRMQILLRVPLAHVVAPVSTVYIA
jgi:hypothetical protein